MRNSLCKYFAVFTPYINCLYSRYKLTNAQENSNHSCENYVIIKKCCNKEIHFIVHLYSIFAFSFCMIISSQTSKINYDVLTGKGKTSYAKPAVCTCVRTCSRARVHETFCLMIGVARNLPEICIPNMDVQCIICITISYCLPGINHVHWYCHLVAKSIRQ